MERTFSQDDRIRRAEEIYARRKNLRERTKRATVNVSEPKNYRLLKKVALQILICVFLYYIFYLINTTNYTFSDNAISKTKEVMSYDFDFQSVYNSIVESVNKFLYEDKKEEDINSEGENNIDNTSKENNEGNLEENKDEEEGVNQSEVSYTEESETERIKHNYSFILPLKGGTVSSEYGEREVTASVVTAYHKGIDIAANTGEIINAATDGEVVISRYSSSYGNYIMIQNNEVKTVYAHCSELLVSVRRYNYPRSRNSKSWSNTEM